MDVSRPNWELSNGHEIVANVIFGAVALAALVYAIRLARTERKRYPLFAMLGAGLCVFYEPINNVLGHCTYGEVGQVTGLHAFGRKIPTFINWVYLFYLSAPILWLMGRIRAGVTVRQWWRYYAVGVVLCTSFELIPIHYKWWAYYGDNQGLRTLGFPMWWWFANPMCLFVMATVFHALRQRVISDRLSPMLVPLWPMMFLATHGPVAIPIYTALNSTSSTVVTTFATLLTIGLSLMMMWITGHLVATDQPTNSKDAGRRSPVPVPA
jgi:hypothetical protein